MKAYITMLVAIAAFILMGSANAQLACGDRASFVEFLAKTEAARPATIGLTSQGDVLEVLISETGRWTIIITTSKGPTCLVSRGDSWEFLPVVAGGHHS